MKKIFFCVTALVGSLMHQSFAGNPDRSGQAGAYELLINPFAKSAGMGSVSIANCIGVESMRMNVAGLAGNEGTEINFSKNVWLQLNGADMGVNDLGFAQKLGKNGGVLGINILSMTFGSIPITTTAVPDVVNGQATLGTFKPQFINLTLSYAKKFSQSIQGGVGFTALSEQIPNATASGFAMDAGIQYTPVAQPQIHFGISLRNIGTPMSFSGDGLSFLGTSQSGTYNQTQKMPSAEFELPSQLNIGGAYDFNFVKLDEDNFLHKITLAGVFISNSFSADQFGVGAQYSYRSKFFLHAGYRYQAGMLSNTQIHTNVYTGLSAGFSFELPLKKDGPRMGFDYSYRLTNPFNGTHCIGVRVTI